VHSRLDWLIRECARLAFLAAAVLFVGALITSVQ
jgi:hypothetical protein